MRISMLIQDAQPSMYIELIQCDLILDPKTLN
jgi:hypothetical protein